MTADYFLTTARLGFWHWTEGDLDLAVTLWGDPRVTRLIDARPQLTRDEVRERLDLEIRNQRDLGVQYWPFFVLGSGAFAGCCGLKPYEGDPTLHEMGFHVRFDHWGKGLATEAARAVIEYAGAALHLPLVVAGHNPANHPSKRILEKLGFRHFRDEVFSGTGLVHPLYELRLGSEPGTR